MKIMAAFSNLEELRLLLENGCDEVFCGMISDGRIGGNHRPNNNSCNLSGISEIGQAIELTHKFNKKICLVINEIGYTDSNIMHSAEFIRKIDSMGIDRFTISDIGLLDVINRKEGMNLKAGLTLSSIVPCFNKESFKFFKRLGIERFVIPQPLYPSELKEYISEIGAETECFFNMTNNCRSTDGICFYTYNSQIWRNQVHIDACDNVTSVKKNGRFSLKGLYNYHNPVWLDPYGAVYDYAKIGVDFLKLGNRQAKTSEKMKFFRIAKYMADLLKTDVSRRRFIVLSRFKALREGVLV